MTTTAAPVEESIIEKVRKLLRLADPANGGTVPEMETALRKAQELMTRHGIEQMQIDDKRDPEAIQQEISNTGRRKDTSDYWIPMILKSVFSVKVLYGSEWTGKHTRDGRNIYNLRYYFFGEPDDIQLAKLAVNIIRNSMIEGFNKYVKAVGSTRNIHTKDSYYRGVAEGFIKESTHGRQAAMKRFKQEEQDRFSIVLLDKIKRIDSYIKGNVKTSSAKARSYKRHDAQAFQAGKTHGASIDFTTKIS